MPRGTKRTSTRDKVLAKLVQIVGLPLSAAHRAADMRTLQFGKLRQINRGSVGDFALHIQCPWRIEGPDGIVTGRMDLYEPINAGPNFDLATWDYNKSPNLQDAQFNMLLAHHAADLIVENVDSDEYGGAVINFRRGFVLRLFPAGTCGENWRFFRPRSSEPHFVIANCDKDAK